MFVIMRNKTVFKDKVIIVLKFGGILGSSLNLTSILKLIVKFQETQRFEM